jgi:hypothetical protein
MLSAVVDARSINAKITRPSVSIGLERVGTWPDKFRHALRYYTTQIEADDDVKVIGYDHARAPNSGQVPDVENESRGYVARRDCRLVERYLRCWNLR